MSRKTMYASLSEMKRLIGPFSLPKPPSIDELEVQMTSSSVTRRGLGQKDKCRLSLITVVFNGDQTIKKTIDSIRTEIQGLNAEYIIIDGGSTDETLDILKENEDTIHCWISEPDKGMYDAVNKGIALANGDFIHLVNSDDLVPPGSLKEALTNLEKYEDDVLLKGDMSLIDAQGNDLRVLGQTDTKRFFFPKEYPFSHPTWFFPRSLYVKLGGYQTVFKIASDHEYFYRILNNNIKIIHIDKVLSFFQVGGMSDGYDGLLESWLINKEYLGSPTALIWLADLIYKKSRRKLLLSVLGEQRVHLIAARLSAIRQRTPKRKTYD